MIFWGLLRIKSKFWVCACSYGLVLLGSEIKRCSLNWDRSHCHNLHVDKLFIIYNLVVLAVSFKKRTTRRHKDLGKKIKAKRKYSVSSSFVQDPQSTHFLNGTENSNTKVQNPFTQHSIHLTRYKTLTDCRVKHDAQPSSQLLFGPPCTGMFVKNIFFLRHTALIKIFFQN